MYIEKNVNGTWQRVGYSANIKPLEYGTTLGMGYSQVNIVWH